MFLWPSTTPGSVCTSTSCRAARCVSAKLRICVCANLMSSITPCGKARTHSAISLSESLNAGGDHLSNFSEYSRTAASPRAAMAERIASTVLRTCALFSALASADWPDLRWRIMACSQIESVQYTTIFTGCTPSESVPQKNSAAVNLERPAFVLLEVPEGRHTVAHRLNGGMRGTILCSPEGAAQLVRPVPPVRGLALGPHAYPPLAQWAAFFRP